MSRRPWAAVAVVLVAALVLVLVGRWEGSGHADRQNAGIAKLRDAVGPLDNPTLHGFRFLARFQCLVYRRGANEFALELCVDRDGRVVEALDRRSGAVHWWSLREEPARATVRVDRAEFERLLVAMCPACGDVLERERAEQ